MSAFKKLNRQDVFVTSYTAKKEWSTNGSAPSNFGIEKYEILSGSFPYYSGSVNYEKNLRYEQLKHLYYSNFSSSLIFGFFENYLQSSLESGSRTLSETGSVLSIPRDVTGQRIEPGTLVISYTSGSISSSIIDNSEGKLVISQSNNTPTGSLVGDVIYTHGLTLITTSSEASKFNDTTNYTASWQSNYPILTQNVICKVSDFEFNFTQNPSAVTSGSDGKLADNITGSDFRPYITAIGLYNDANELIAVGKFGQPIPKPSYVDTTFILKLDL
jgi:hypothetical protein